MSLKAIAVNKIKQTWYCYRENWKGRGKKALQGGEWHLEAEF